MKIGLGFAVGALITVAVGVVGIAGLTRIAGTIDKTAVANRAFVAMSELHQSFSDYLASHKSADAQTVTRKIATLGETIGQLDNGDQNFAHARSALASLTSQLAMVATSNEKFTSALAEIDGLSQQLSASVDQISAQANKVTASAAADEAAAIKSLNAVNNVNPLIDQFTAAVFKSSSLVQKYVATGDDGVEQNLLATTDKLSSLLSGMTTFQLDASIPKVAATIADMIKEARANAEALPTLYAKATAAGATAEDKDALADAANGLSFSYESISARSNSIRIVFVNTRNAAVRLLQNAGQKRNNANDIALIGQKTSQAISSLVIATKDFLAAGNQADVKRVTAEIDKMMDVATNDDDAGATTGLADIVTKYRAAFQTVIAVLTSETTVTKSAQAAAADAVASISAISDKILDETAKTTSSQRLLALATLGLGCIVTIVFAIWTARSVRNPINALTRIMGRLADGDTNVAPPGVNRSDEIGAMSRTVEIFRDAAIEKRRLEADASAEATERAARQARIDAMIRDFRAEVERMLAGVADQTAKMQGTAQRLNQAADQSQRQALSASGASSEASENVSTVAASAEELAASVTEIAMRVQKTVEIVGTASDQASVSNERIASLAQSAARIGDVVKLIRSIADQTNLLALNATIEAARAGDAGKGFAVVAAEVKQLADQTAKATQDIAAQVDGIQTATRQAVDSIGGITQSMSAVNSYTASIASAVSQQGAATSEISRNAQGASQGTQMVAQSMDTLVKTSEDTTEAASEVNSVAREVTAANATLTRTIDHFLQTVAAA
jgi:methyl-accepting chemotaxis protein